ncbi:dienelactone hydrolase endo-1,3,1,4-beta-D-glucanase [Cylindrobasidium torrendii FP15055 ss-10]|uniref:Dienelactone hydrolase endo-1,3,1,4-beta-D-glucanase n=1 Tax=Cylindrobasidium torrendii FP15055 ss-10 TaxID=1314674 RepID=A0A0D7B457_9AGAR|nr:dienelactone hydrolase endo-1,3,1,4-beta-D-glucanase [Cylindrobasidium torrendii FP15055 ss-10]
MSCPDCFRGVAFDTELRGVLTDVEGAYLATPKGETSSTTHAVIVLTDIFGLQLPNAKVLADLYAEQLGCDVWVPDLFGGKAPVTPDAMRLPVRAGDRFSIWEWIKVAFAVLPSAFALYQQRPVVTDVRLKTFLSKLKEKKSYQRLGAVGFCYGGTTAVRFASTDTFSTVVVCHPGKLTEAELHAMKVPCSWVLAEDDLLFPPKNRLAAEAEFAGRVGKDNYVQYEFAEYKGTTHGFAARPNLEFPDIKEGFEGAQAQIVSWFKKTLLA